MQHDIWANPDAEQPYFPFIGKYGINVDIEEPRNLLEYCELFCKPGIA
jgi:hypothetical protein